MKTNSIPRTTLRVPSLLAVGARHGHQTALGSFLLLFLLALFSVTGRVEAAGAPRFLVQPQGGSVVVGDALFLAVNVDDPAAMLQWHKDGTALAEATDSVLWIEAVTPEDAGRYTCVATNAAGRTVSAAAQVAVTPPPRPSFTLQPVGGSFAIGGTFTLSAEVSDDTADLQWYKDGQVLEGEIGPELARTNLTASDAGEYSCVATNSVGETRSNIARVAIFVPRPVFVTQPVGVTIDEGRDFRLTVAVDDPTAALQWSRGSTVLAGATAATLEIRGATGANSGDYTCTATNRGGPTKSEVAKVVVRPVAPPKITRQPLSISVPFGGTADFSVVVNGGGELTYQWQKDGQDLEGATEPTLTIAEVTVDRLGSYRVIVSNRVGEVTSAAAALTTAREPGRYAGLVLVEDEIAPVTSGFMKLDVTASSRFSGTLVLAGVRYGFSGMLDEDGAATVAISRRVGAPAVARLSFAVENDERVSGLVTIGAQEATLALERSDFAPENPCPWEGRYTVLLPADDAVVESPAGTGYLALKIAANGSVSASGRLADGSTVSGESVVTGEGALPLCFAVTRLRRAVVLGWLTVDDAGISQSLTWVQAPGRAGAFPEGFTVELASRGSFFDPAESTLDEPLKVMIDASEFDEPLVLELGEKTRRGFKGPGGTMLTLAADGTFSGRFTNPATRRTVGFFGALDQSVGEGSGFFVTGSTFGQVRVEEGGAGRQ